MDVLSKISKEREERVQDLHLDLPIPTWDKDLVARFSVMPRKQMEKFSDKKRTLEVDLDFLIQACTALYARDVDHSFPGERMEENDDYVLVADDDGPVTFEERLGRMLGMTEEQDPTRARNVVMYCFKDNGIAVSGFVIRVVTWMQNTDAKVAADLVGE